MAAVVVAVALAALDRARPVEIVLLATTAVLGAVVATTVGRRWEPTTRWADGYLGALALLSAVSVATVTTTDSQRAAFLLIPIGVGGVVLSGRRQATLVIAASAAYVVAGWLGGGITPAATAARLLILGTVGIVVWFVTCRLERAYQSALTAQRVADDRARRMEVVARSARRIETAGPDGIVAATLAAAGELGWPAAALVLAAGDDDARLVETRGFRLPDDPMTGAVTRAMRLGVTVHPSPGDPAVVVSGLATVLVAPVRVAGVSRGALLVGDGTARRPDRTDEEAVSLVAGQAGRALEVAGRLERELHRIEVLEQVGRDRDDFVSTVAHELRTPLTAIIGLTETVRRYQHRLPEDRRADILARVEANARALEGIVTSMLDLARLERGTLDVLPEPVDLSDVAMRTVRRLEPLLRSHTVTVDPAGVAATVAADVRLIERVVENLLTNAGRHTPPGTRIVIRTVVDGGRVVLEIRDDGPGMTPDEVAAIGERFRRGGVRGRRERSGAGLGLSLVTEILQLHGSHLQVSSRLGVGTRFAFALPRAAEVEVELDVSSLTS